MSLYNILNLQPDCSYNDIKKSYHKLALKFHPDKNNNNTTLKFQQIKYAYEILSDNNTRQKYHLLNNLNKSKFEKFIESIFKENIGYELLKSFGFELTFDDYNKLNKYIEKYDYNEIFNFFNKNKIIEKQEITQDCSDIKNKVLDEPEYFYKLPLAYQKYNKNNIILNLNIDINQILQNETKQLVIKRNINNKLKKYKIIFDLTHPYIVFYNGGDICKSIDGHLIIKLNINNFDWSYNNIIYNNQISLYQFIYGLNLSLNLGYKKIFLENYKPINNGMEVIIDDLPNDNFNLIIKLNIDYKENDLSHKILKEYFN